MSWRGWSVFLSIFFSFFETPVIQIHHFRPIIDVWPPFLRNPLCSTVEAPPHGVQRLQGRAP